MRASYHDWLDDPTGYPLGTSIRVFEADLQRSLEDWDIYLKEMSLMDIGAHAYIHADRLLARDRGFLRDYFTELEVWIPKNGEED